MPKSIFENLSHQKYVLEKVHGKMLQDFKKTQDSFKEKDFYNKKTKMVTKTQAQELAKQAIMSEINNKYDKTLKDESNAKSLQEKLNNIDVMLDGLGKDFETFFEGIPAKKQKLKKKNYKSDYDEDLNNIDNQEDDFEEDDDFNKKLGGFAHVSTFLYGKEMNLNDTTKGMNIFDKMNPKQNKSLSVVLLSNKHKPLQPSKPFSKEISLLQEKSLIYAQENFAPIFNLEKRRFQMLVAQLFPLKISTVMSWGQEALNNQQKLHKNTFLLVKQFHELKGSELLDEIVVVADKRKTSKPNFFLSMIQKPASKEDLQTRLNTLRVKVNEFMEPLDKKYQEVKASALPLWLTTLACVAEVTENTEEVTSDIALLTAMTQRRSLLRDASEQTEMIKSQLNQIRVLIVELKNRMDHIENITLTALAMLDEK